MTAGRAVPRGSNRASHALDLTELTPGGTARLVLQRSAWRLSPAGMVPVRLSGPAAATPSAGFRSRPVRDLNHPGADQGRDAVPPSPLGQAGQFASVAGRSASFLGVARQAFAVRLLDRRRTMGPPRTLDGASLN